MLMAAAVGSGNPAAAPTKLTAYNYAVRCFFANGRMAELLSRRGDLARAATFRGNAQRSHQGAVTLGRGAGLSDAQMALDLDAFQSLEPARLVSDAAYFDKTASACKALGLM
jgi:hypothetical protein